MPAGFTRGFAERLDRLTPLRAREAEGGEEPASGTVLVAPGGCHLELESVGLAGRGAGGAAATPSDKYAPSVDRLFESAAKHFGADLLAVVLTGMGDDGRRGVRAVKDCGGAVIAESEATRRDLRNAAAGDSDRSRGSWCCRCSEIATAIQARSRDG